MCASTAVFWPGQASPAMEKHRIGRIVTDQARTGVRRQRVCAVRAKPAGMRIRSESASGREAAARPTDGTRGVAGDAVAFLVAADAGTQVSLRFPGVVCGRTRAATPDAARRMESTSRGKVRGWTAFTDPDALVAVETERLAVMAAGASRTVVPGRLGVER